MKGTWNKTRDACFGPAWQSSAVQFMLVDNTKDTDAPRTADLLQNKLSTAVLQLLYRPFTVCSVEGSVCQ